MRPAQSLAGPLTGSGVYEIETNLSAEQLEEEKEPRVSRPDEDPWRTGGSLPQAGQGTKEARPLGQLVPKGRAVRQRLRKPERLRKQKDFQELFRYRQVARGRDFRVHYRFREQGSSPNVRAAFVAGKRIGKSVTRNRIKRLLREAFRRVKSDLRPERGVDLLFVANRDFSGRSSPEVEEDMREILERIGILPPPSAKEEAEPE